MKKFIEALKSKYLSLATASLPFALMSKVIASNPRIMIGVTGVRHIQRAAGLSVWPVFYMSKEQVEVIITNKKKKTIFKKKKQPKKETCKIIFFLAV